VTHLLDTDVVVDILRRDHNVRRRLDASPGPVAMSSITLMELSYGVQRSSTPPTNRSAVETLLAFVPVLDFGAAAAQEAGMLRAELAVRGEPIGAYDVLIAGHARAAGLVLATANVREFARVSGLSVENWRTPR
jgi:tRNA(fMet)-specific endonuclease VapC